MRAGPASGSPISAPRFAPATHAEDLDRGDITGHYGAPGAPLGRSRRRSLIGGEHRRVRGQPLGSTPAVNDLVFTATLTGSIVALDRGNGKTMWRQKAPGRING
jgi:hypothetical protein